MINYMPNLNIAVLGICDFEEWNNPNSSTIGGIAGVIKSILPHLNADKIYLFGITSNKSKLKREFTISENIISFPIIYIPKNSKIPDRVKTFWQSRNINIFLNKFYIKSIYSHAEEMLCWVDPNINSIYHMHGSSNAISKAKQKYFRNAFFQYLWGRIRKKNFQKAHHIIAIDNLCLDIVKKFKYNHKAFLLPNFVDTSIFYYDIQKSAIINSINEKIVLFVGRLEEVKGLELFIDIVSHLDRKESGAWKGVLVGDGSYKPKIEKYINNNSKNELFIFTGAIFDQIELRKIYSQSNVLIISSFHEGIPMVILEALACNTPVISTNVGGIKELISDGKNCFVYEKRDPLNFVEKILNLSKTKNKNLPDNFRFSVKNASIKINKLLKK